MAGIYDTNTIARDPMQVMSANNMIQDKNWLQRNADWITPVGTTAAQIGYNIYANEKNNEFNKDEAQKQRNWEEYMSSTAYQRAYEDMRMAGLNPHLAGGQGGASTPSGSAAATTGMMPADLSSLNAYALQTAQTQAQVENLKADTQLKGKQAGKTQAETRLTETMNEIQPILMKAQAALANTQSGKAKQETLTELQRTAQAGFATLQAKMETQKRQWGYQAELDIYKKELELQMINLGFDTSTIGLVLNAIGRTGQATKDFHSFTGKSGDDGRYMKGFDAGWKSANQ